MCHFHLFRHLQLFLRNKKFNNVKNAFHDFLVPRETKFLWKMNKIACNVGKSVQNPMELILINKVPF